MLVGGSITSSKPLRCISVHDSWYDTLGSTKVRGHDLMHFDTIRCATILLRRFQLLVILWKETIVKFQTDPWHSKYESIKQKTMNKKTCRNRGFSMYALCKVQGNLNYLHTYVSIVKERTFLACTYYLCKYRYRNFGTYLVLISY